MTKSSLFNKGNAILRIQSILDSLNYAEKKLAEYIIENPKEAVNMTIEELARASTVSYATINRFCRKLEYSGYKEFRSNLVHYLANNKNVDDLIQSLGIKMNMTFEEILENTYGLAYKVLEESLAFMDISVVEAVVDTMLKAGRICFIGTGTSGICAMYGYTQCMRIGLPCQYQADATIYRMGTSLLKKGDVLFAISSSGRTASIVETARMAKRNGVTVISLSDFAISPLSKVSDYNLYTTPRNGATFLNIDMPLFMGQATILDLLYTCLCVKSPKQSSDAYSKTRASVDAEKLK